MTPLRIALTAAQRKQVAALQLAAQHAQVAVTLYVQAIADSVDAPDGTAWALEADALVGAPPDVKE